eukprot:SAG22_NODE_18083_length_293_cov_1.680412_1_plen_77_part_10
MHGRKYEQRDWKSYSYQEDSDWRKKSLQMPQVARHQDTEYTSTLHDRLGRQITRDGSIKFKPGTLRYEARRGYSGFT